MVDFDRLVAWYLNPLTRISRGAFNVLILLLTLPVFWIKMQGGVETLTGKVQQIAPVIENARGMSTSGGNIGSMDIESILRSHEKTRAIAQEFVATMQDDGSGNSNAESMRRQAGEFDLDTDYSIDTPSDRFVLKDLVKVLNVAIYVFLIPIMFMRMRDMGLRSNVSMWVTIAAVYGTFAADALSMFNILEVGFVLNAMLAVLSFFIFMWLCTHKTKKMEEAPHKNYMPGDNTNDPY
jgi:uncharacterized membrane protein YhaH (DUF805 family)